MLNKIKILFTIISFTSILFSAEYSNYGFDIFEFSFDPESHSFGGIANLNSMSLINIYNLNDSHTSGKSLFSYGSINSQQIKLYQFSYILPSLKKNRVGLSIITKKIPDLDNTSLAINSWDGISEITSEDVDYDKISSYDDCQTSLILMFSVDSNLGTHGFRMKLLNHSIINNYNNGISFDISFTKKFGKNFDIGLQLSDFISYLRWDSGSEYMIFPKLSMMNSYLSDKQSLISEITILSNYNNSFIVNYNIGYEVDLYNKIKFRFGYSSLKSLCGGFEISKNKISYAYSFCPNLNNFILGQEHQFSILLGLP